MTNIVVVGAGGHARVVADVIRLGAEYQVRGFLDGENASRRGTEFEGAAVLGGDEVLLGLREEGVRHAAVAVGDNAARLRIADQLLELGFELPALVHPDATVAASVHLGAGTVVFARAVVNPATRLGRVVIINTAASVDHDCEIGDAVHIAPGAHLAGGVKVASGALVGIGAAVRPRLTIGRNAVVGAGAAVVADVAAGTTVAGVPARVLR